MKGLDDTGLFLIVMEGGGRSGIGGGGDESRVSRPIERGESTVLVV